jgi:hypothetical protein
MKLHPIAVWMTAAFGVLPLQAQAQTQAELMQELARSQAAMSGMAARLGAIEALLKQRQEETAATSGEQQRQLDSLVVRTEGLVTADETMGRKDLKISGYIDPTFIYTSRQNRAGFQFLNASVNANGSAEYAFDNGAFGGAMIDFQKTTEGGAKWRLTLAPNRVGGGNAIDGKSIVHEASLWFPLMDQNTRLIAGQIPEWSGHELLPGNQTKLITHGLLFDYALPAVYTGAGLELVRGNWTIKSMLANVNGSKKNNGEKAPVLVYRVDYFDYSKEFSGFGFAGLNGRMANFRAADGVGNPVTGLAYDGRDTMVNTFEADGFFSRGDWTFTGQVSVGMQRRAAITADPVSGALRDSQWWGASATVARKLTPRLEAITRVDYFNNRKNGGGALGYTFADSRNGLGPDSLGDPNVGANRSALAFGLRYAIEANLMWKAEYRVDLASLPVFLDVGTGSFKRSNQLFGSSLVLGF